MRKLRDGDVIAADENAAARAVMSSFRRHPELGWLYGLVSLAWVFVASLAPGHLRSAYVTVGVVWLAVGAYRWWLRQRILGREAEIAPYDSL